MASNESIFDKLNLSSGERRLVMIVVVVLLCALTWMVWGMIPDPGATQQKIDTAKNDLKRFDGEITNKEKYNRQIRELEGMGSAVVKIEQEVNMRRTINNLTAANGVRVTRLGRTTTKTNEFFQEYTMRVDFSSKESNIVNFLWKLGESDSMVRVSDLLLKPDKNRYRLDGWMNLTASYQKDIKAPRPRPAAETKPKSEAAKPEAKPTVAAEPEPTKPAAKPEPAKSEAKPSGSKRTVPVPTRRVRPTQNN
ncbi:MAG: hypothetical protein QGG00_05210 [Verrucomicrobiota bacterium]|jgi:Tfp pilus assembly protein PilO|nr:hypothetical protein [Verrucomicrobiota bacterium]